MTLRAGTRLHVYEITGPLGAGGMGEVFRARDTRLNRDVKIKMLPDSVALDQERLARFEREARTLAGWADVILRRRACRVGHLDRGEATAIRGRRRWTKS
jgi:serine/threonine protein kinase